MLKMEDNRNNVNRFRQLSQYRSDSSFYTDSDFHHSKYYVIEVLIQKFVSTLIEERCPQSLTTLMKGEVPVKTFQTLGSAQNECVTNTVPSADDKSDVAKSHSPRYRVHIPRAVTRPGEDDINLVVTEAPPLTQNPQSNSKNSRTGTSTDKKKENMEKIRPKTRKQSVLIVAQEVSVRRGLLCFAKECTVLSVWKAAAESNTSAVICLIHKDFQVKSLQHGVSRLRSAMSHRNQREDDHAAIRHSRHYDNERKAESIPFDAHSTDDGLFDVEKITKLLHASHYSMIVQIVLAVLDKILSELLVAAHFVVGVAYFKMSNFKSAEQHFQKSEEEARRRSRRGDIMLCNAYLGDIKYASQSYLDAADHYKVAIRYYAEGSVAVVFKLTPPTISAVHAKCASSFRNASRMVQAVHEYKTAIEKAQIDRDRLSAHTSLGNLYQSMGDNSNALAEYKQSIELAEKLSDYVSLGWAHGNIGNAYLGLNRKDEAVHHLQKSLDLAVEYEQTPQAIGRTYNNLGTAYQSMNDLDKAEEYYDLALSQAVYGNDIAGQARVYGNIGNVHMLRKNYERAIPHYSEVLRLSSDPATISTARHNRGCAYYEWATSLHKPTKHSSPQGRIRYHNERCDEHACLESIPAKAKDLYRRGRDDLEKVVKYHEEKFQHIKGASKGLTLSVSLFESNSRSFHRLQDCLINLHEWEKALVVAEQSRARTLGELMLKRKEHLLEDPLTSPLPIELSKSVTKSQKSPLVYLSYTGARLLGWVITTNSDKYAMKTFEVPLDDDQFEGKSFDYYLRYSLNEKLVERSFEMYQSIKYDESSSSSVQILHSLVAAPIIKLLQDGNSGAQFDELILISDSYTSLLPLTCLFDSEAHSFFGDQYYLRSVPSLLTLGVMSQMPEVVVNVQEDQREFCIIGDPSIPPFHQNGEIWTLGKLPYARREAEWVAHTLGTIPMLNEMATKSALLIRLMKAKVVHIATHGSASAGFLAFAAFMVQADGSSRHVRGENVLLFPEDVEKLNISPALVVLSSCDSGRGTVKADGIQGMARAFILAGAQSVLTTLWKVPDESASVFMQFFYQYLMDGLKSSLALHKAILSVRCFAKYSQYIHWSGYQLTGQDIHFVNKLPVSVAILRKRLGPPSVFPRLSDLKKLQKVFLDNPSLPTDFQIIQGSPGARPSEVVIDFITSCHKQFNGGIFWIYCSQTKFIEASIEYIEKETGHQLINLPLSEKQQVLLVLDGPATLPDSEPLLRIMKHQFVHVIVLSKSQVPNDKLIKEVDQKLIRGCKVHTIDPLSDIHSTQRLVHRVMSDHDCVPTNDDQQAFENLAEFTLGSPVIIDIASLVLHQFFQVQQSALEYLTVALSLGLSPVKKREEMPSSTTFAVRAISENVDKYLHSTVATLTPQKRDVWETSSHYDSWDSVLQLVDLCELSSEERLLLNCLSVFNYCPIPLSVVTELSSTIAASSQKPHLAGTLHHKLMKFNLIKSYPLPVVLHSSSSDRSSELEPEFLYIPQLISSSIFKNFEKVDLIAALTLAHHTIVSLCSSTPNSVWLSAVCCVFLNTLECNFKIIGKDCYQELYGLYLKNLM